MADRQSKYAILLYPFAFAIVKKRTDTPPDDENDEKPGGLPRALAAVPATRTLR